MGDACAAAPVVVGYAEDEGWLIDGALEDRPSEQLFVADENGGAVVGNGKGRGAGEAKGCVVFAAERLPHGEGDGVALNEGALVLADREQDVLVVCRARDGD